MELTSEDKAKLKSDEDGVSAELASAVVILVAAGISSPVARKIVFGKKHPRDLDRFYGDLDSEKLQAQHDLETSEEEKRSQMYAVAFSRLLSNRVIHEKGVSYPNLSRAALTELENGHENANTLYEAVIKTLIK